MEVLKEKNYEFLWFLTPNLSEKFPFQEEPHTFKISETIAFKSDAIVCPGNEVPYYLRGVKVQIFHGLAGEKKGHFRIRHYFDLYLTQGPYFTGRFNQLKRKYKNFEVIETGWSKLDIYGKETGKYQQEKKELLNKKKASKIILYAPTFSPSLTSAPSLLKQIELLAKNKDYLVFIKFHDLMAEETVAQYKKLADRIDNIIVQEEPNIVKFLLMADVMISDTSSVVYEFLLLNKPVITYKSNSDNILWDNSTEFEDLPEKVATNIEVDEYSDQRLKVIEKYHPYNDGKSALRMVEAIESYISKKGVPTKRKLPFLRKMKINRIFKRI